MVTLVSYEISSKSHVSNLQNEHIVRDFLQKSSGNTLWSTHITQPCQAVSRIQPLQTTSIHTPIPLGQRHLTTSQFLVPATNLSVYPRLTRTKYYAYHEMSPPFHLATSPFPTSAAKIALCLSRKVTISTHVNFNKISPIPHIWKQNFHHTTHLE